MNDFDGLAEWTFSLWSGEKNHQPFWGGFGWGHKLSDVIWSGGGNWKTGVPIFQVSSGFTEYCGTSGTKTFDMYGMVVCLFYQYC